jgi:predicted nucleic acid-binding protein
MYLLDTNICIFAMKNTYPALSHKLFRILPSEILYLPLPSVNWNLAVIKANGANEPKAS